MDELTREFLIESQEGLDRMERCLTDLEERPDDSALLAEIFRSVHTIKGTTGFLGYKRLERLAHSGENLLGLLAMANSLPTLLSLPCCCNCSMAFASSSSAIETDETEGTGDDAYFLRLTNCTLPRNSGWARRSYEEASTRKIDALGKAPRAARIGRLAFATSPRPSAGAKTETPASNPPMFRVPPPACRRIRRPEAFGRSAISAAESTLRVDVTLLNRMMNLVGELVLTRNQVLQATAANPTSPTSRVGSTWLLPISVRR